MKRWLLGALALVILLCAAAIAFFAIPAPLDPVSASATQPQGAALVARGHYLATAADCAACHSVPGGRPFAGGLAFNLPFGTIYSSNITPDRKAGIGAWTDAEFVRAMRHGVRADGQELYPAFPYAAYTNMRTDDVLAIFAYLKTLPPVAQPGAANRLSFPFNQRFLMRAWKLFNMPRHPIAADPDRPAEWNRGYYLVEGFGHCAECHTPRNILFGLKRAQGYAGAITQGWKAYNISADPRTGIGNWSTDEIAQYLGTGHAAGHGAAAGSMAEAVSLSLSHLTAADLHAMAVYLKSLPPRGSAPEAAVNAAPPALAGSSLYAPPAAEARGDAQGLRLFEGACASCHGWNGEGLQSPYGALRGARTVNDPAATNLIQVILHGSSIAPGQGGRVSMPAFGAAYTDAEIAALSNYVLAHFGGKKAAITPMDVAKARRAGA